MVGGPGARLTDPWVQAEIGGQLAPIAEAADVADGGHEGRRDDDVDAGDGHQPLDLGPAERLGGDELIDRGDLGVEKVDLAQASVDRLALADRQLLLAEPARPLTPNRSDAGGRSFRQRISTAWISFCPGARPDQLRAARQPAAHHPDALIRRPDPVELARPQQLGQRAGVEPVGLGPRLADAGVVGETTITRATWRSRMRAICPRIAGHLQRDQSRGSRLWANSSSASGRVWIDRPSATGRPRRSPPRRSRGGHPALPLSLISSPSLNSGEPVANGIDGSALAAQPGKSQGRPLRKPGLEAHRAKTACPACVLPKAPVPVDRSLARPRTHSQAFTEQFHAARSRRATADFGEAGERASIAARGPVRRDETGRGGTAEPSRWARDERQ